MAEKKISDAWRFVFSIAFCLGVGFTGSFFTGPNIPGWYAKLAKPAFTPPDFVFAPVWTVLYVLMGIALFFVWRRGLAKQPVEDACVVFMIQLFLNCFWSIVFFGGRSIFSGMVIIVLLWALIVLTMVLFYRVDRLAALLLSPYLLWVSFASVLNWYLLKLN